MAEGLATAEGAKVEDVKPVQDFAELQVAQAEAADEAAGAEVSPPPKKDPDAPYGRRADGTPKKGPGGRPPKDKPRVAGPKAAQVKKDFTQPLHELVQLAWGTLVPFSPADAGAVKLAGPALVSAWNTLAQENATVARGIEWLTSGSAYGAVVMATAPLVFQVLVNHGKLPHERVAALGVQDPGILAEMTARDVAAMAQAAQGAQGVE